MPDSRISASSVPSAMPPTIATSVSWTEKMKPLRMKLWMTPQSRKPKSRFSSHHLPPIMPGTCTRFSMNGATRLTANAEMKYRPVTAR